MKNHQLDLFLLVIVNGLGSLGVHHNSPRKEAANLPHLVLVWCIYAQARGGFQPQVHQPKTVHSGNSAEQKISSWKTLWWVLIVLKVSLAGWNHISATKSQNMKCITMEEAGSRRCCRNVEYFRPALVMGSARTQFGGQVSNAVLWVWK